jgi:DNA-binding response OmpR family regulator
MDGVLVVELDVDEQLGVKRVGRALGRAAEALGVGSEVEKWRTCEEDVVIEVATQRVWVCGVLIALGDLPYRLLELLAKSGRVVPTKELGAKLSSASIPDEVARRAKVKLEAQVSNCVARAGVVWDAAQIVVTEGKKGYRLGVAVRVLA